MYFLCCLFCPPSSRSLSLSLSPCVLVFSLGLLLCITSQRIKLQHKCTHRQQMHAGCCEDHHEVCLEARSFTLHNVMYAFLLESSVCWRQVCHLALAVFVCGYGSGWSTSFHLPAVLTTSLLIKEDYVFMLLKQRFGICNISLNVLLCCAFTVSEKLQVSIDHP